MDGGSIPPSSTPHIIEPYPDVTPVFYIPVVTNSISIEAPEGLPKRSPVRPIVVRVDRPALRHIGHDEVVPSGPNGMQLVELFDSEGLPNSHPFVVGTDASMLGTEHLNRYLLAAHRESDYEKRSLSTFHAPKLTTFLRWLWNHHGEPVELTVTTTEHLRIYKKERLETVASSSWDTELGCMSSFFKWARDAGLMNYDPMPRWGTRQRNTMRVRLDDRRTPLFLQERELRFFLHVGMSGDVVYGNRPLSFTGSHIAPPASPMRDFAIGFIEVTTGLRREETARLLDIEIPTRLSSPLDHPLLGGNELQRFIRYGKLGKPRWVYVTSSVVDVLDEYRATERRRIIEAAQPRLKNNLAQLLVVNAVRVHSGKSQIHIGSAWRDTNRLSDEDRARAVIVTDDSVIEPLGLFLSRLGLPPALNYLNEIYKNANERAAHTDHPDRPSIRVSNHTMRHTFAVRTLAALIQESDRVPGEPYALITNPVFTVQELLGHSDPETTARYLRAAERYEAVPTVLQSNAKRIAKNLETESDSHD
jgi:integrase